MTYYALSGADEPRRDYFDVKMARVMAEKRIKHHEISTKLSFVDIMYELKCPSTTALKKKILHKVLEVQYGVENIPLFEKTMKLFSPTSSIMQMVRDDECLNKNHNYDNVLRLARSHHAQFNFSQRITEVEGLSPEGVDLEELDINPLVIEIFFLGDEDIKNSQMLHYYKKINAYIRKKYQKQENEAKVESIFDRDTSDDTDVNLDSLAWPSLDNLGRGLPQPVEYQHHDLRTDDSLESIESNKEPLVETELEKKQKFCDLARLFFEESEEIKLERKEKFCDISILLFKDHLPPHLTEDIQVLYRRSSSSNEPPFHRPLVKPTLEHCNLHDPGRHQVDKNKSEERLVKVTKLTKKGRKQKDVIQDDPIRNLTVIRETPFSRRSLFGKNYLQGKDQLPLPRELHPTENTTGGCFKYHHNLMAAIEQGRKI